MLNLIIFNAVLYQLFLNAEFFSNAEFVSNAKIFK